MAKTPTVIAIVGPTAIGKTALSIALAKHYKAPIVSADSRQFFKEMRIGTAVPSTAELATAKHYFIQSKSIQEPYTVGDYETESLNLLKILFKEQDVVIVVGGSGLYVAALLKGLDAFPDIDPLVRKQLNTELEQSGLAPLVLELKKVDPKHYKRVDLKNPHRVLRALEVSRSSGKPYSSYLGKPREPRFFNTVKIGLTADRDILYQRINQRVDLMIQNGLVKEVKELMPYRSLNALQTVGYRELFAHFNGQFTLEEAVEEIKKNTRRFAKRQGTWFRKDKEIKWFDFKTPIAAIIAAIDNSMPK